MPRTNFRVEVTPRTSSDYGFGFSITTNPYSEDEEMRLCEEIAADIRRHVNNLPSKGNRGVQIVWDETP